MLYGGLGLLLGYSLGVGTARFILPAGAIAAEPAPSTVVVAPAPVSVAPRVIATAGRPARGPDGAPVTIVEFTDYECPFCRQHSRQTLPTLLERYGDRVRYVVMNYPLAVLHEHAVAAAEATECAADQGRFWEFHDQLFAADSLTRRSVQQIAKRLSLDSRAFTACVETRARAGLVLGHMALADSLGVTGTPSFFINGRMVDGAQPFPVFQAVIDSALAAAR